MIESARCEGLRRRAGRLEDQARTIGDCADAVDEPGESVGRGGREGEAELEVLAVVKRVVERGSAVAFARCERIGVDGNLLGVEHGAPAAARLEDVAEVGGE